MLKTSLLNKNDIIDLYEYESFVKSHKNGSFFQSLSWVRVKYNWSNEIIIVKEADKIVGSALLLIKPMPYVHGNFLYSPRGPVCDYDNVRVLNEIIKKVKWLAKKHDACMFRMDPCIENNDINHIRLFKSLGFAFKEEPDDYRTIQTRNNYVLDIEGKSEEEVFGSFHSKWRYNTRLSERKGVRCIIGSKDKLDDFYELMKVTGERDNFKIRSKEYFERVMDAFGDNCRLFMCYKDSTPLSGALTVQYAGKTCYVYGASSNESRNLMPNYLMQWTMIKWAIENKCKLYDFMGIPYYFDESHPNYGVYRFKKGFNGRVLSYAGEFDYVFTPFKSKVLQWYLSSGRLKVNSLMSFMSSADKKKAAAEK